MKKENEGILRDPLKENVNEEILVDPLRDIRKAPFEEEDFDISYTDSTNPIEEVLNQVREPGYDYLAAYNDPRRINALLAKKWLFVDPSMIQNRPTFNINERHKDVITISDTILMKRDKRYSERDDAKIAERYKSVMGSSLSAFKKSTDPITQITNIENPFSN